jgi:hypothetical protein
MGTAAGSVGSMGLGAGAAVCAQSTEESRNKEKMRIIE